MSPGIWRRSKKLSLLQRRPWVERRASQAAPGSEGVIDSPALTGGVLNEYERGSSCFTGPCSHPRLHRRGTPAGLEVWELAAHFGKKCHKLPPPLGTLSCPPTHDKRRNSIFELIFSSRESPGLAYYSASRHLAALPQEISEAMQITSRYAPSLYTYDHGNPWCRSG